MTIINIPSSTPAAYIKAFANFLNCSIKKNSDDEIEFIPYRLDEQQCQRIAVKMLAEIQETERIRKRIEYIRHHFLSLYKNPLSGQQNHKRPPERQTAEILPFPVRESTPPGAA